MRYNIYHCSVILALAFLVAISWGYVFGRWMAIPNDALSFMRDERPLVATVHVTGVHNGKLEGTIFGSGRLIIGDEPVTPNADGSFSVDGSAFLRNHVTITVPNTAKFVASIKGKKYYPVFSPGGSNIVLKNRVYFETEREAQAKGYVR